MALKQCPLCDKDASLSGFSEHLESHSELEDITESITSVWYYIAFAGIALTIISMAVIFVSPPIGAIGLIIGYLVMMYGLYRDLKYLHDGVLSAPLIDKLIALITVLVPFWGTFFGGIAFMLRRTAKARRFRTLISRVEGTRKDRQAGDEAIAAGQLDSANAAYDRALDTIEGALELAKGDSFYLEDRLEAEREHIRSLLLATEASTLDQEVTENP